MKICMLTSSYPFWPGHYRGHFVRKAAIEMIKLGHQVTVVAPCEHEALSHEIDNGVEVIRFNYFPIRKMQYLTTGSGILPNLRSNWMVAAQIPLFLLSFSIAARKSFKGHDIIHAHWSINGLPALWCRSILHIPVILSLRGSDYTKKKKSFLNTVSNLVVRRVDGVIAENNELRKKAIATGISVDRTITLRNGVDLDFFTPKQDRSVLPVSGASDGKKIALFVGRLTHVKGPDIALDAFERIVREFPDAYLIVVGDGDMKEGLFQWVSDSSVLKDHVYFAGEVKTDHMPQYYNASNILIISSRSEGTPNVLLEGMASGLSVVSAPVGGVSEVIENDKTGILVEDVKPESLYKGVRRLYKNEELCCAIGKTARAWAEQNLSWKKTVKEYLNLYRFVSRPT